MSATNFAPEVAYKGAQHFAPEIAQKGAQHFAPEIAQKGSHNFAAEVAQKGSQHVAPEVAQGLLHFQSQTKVRAEGRHAKAIVFNCITRSSTKRSTIFALEVAQGLLRFPRTEHNEKHKKACTQIELKFMCWNGGSRLGIPHRVEPINLRQITANLINMHPAEMEETVLQ